MDKELEEKIEQIYASGEIELKDFKKIKNKFNISCAFCGSSNISIITETGDDGYCETCSSPYAEITIKCKKCGQGISIRN